MSDLRDKIARNIMLHDLQILYDFGIDGDLYRQDPECRDAAYVEADAILAALEPAPLVWDGFKSGAYEIVVHEGGIADLFCHAVRDEDNEPELVKGGYLTLVSMDDLKATAQAHHRAQWRKAAGLDK